MRFNSRGAALRALPRSVLGAPGWRAATRSAGGRRLAGVAVVMLSSAVLAAPAWPQSADPRAAHPSAANPLVGLRFFVDSREPSWVQWRRYSRAGRHGRAAFVWRIASRPKFKWFGRFTRRLRPAVRSYIRRARAQGAVPLIAVMRHQGRRCGAGYTAGGSPEDRRTRRWYRRFARAVGSSRVVIAFEPDSLGTVDCLARNRRWARLRLLRYGVKVLSRLPNATIYLEAGASDWEPARRTARQLRYIGIRRVRGFMLNVTHYDWTSRNIRHGLRISRLTGGKPFIVSTAYNGRGPIHFRRWHGARRWRRINVWCNTRRRGLGTPPTTSTSHPKVDAYLWVGRPGYSSGRCNGGPRVGAWWPRRALMFSRYATNWEAPPGR